MGNDGKLVTWNDDQFEPSDSSIIDQTLPTTGTYTIEVDSYQHATGQPSPGGDYELFMYRFAAYNATSGADQIYTATPTVAIASTLPAYSNSTTANFNFTVGNSVTALAYPNLQFLVDGSPVTPGAPGSTLTVNGSSVTLTGLAQGSHTFEMEILAANGNVLAASNVFTWTVDTTPPTVSLASEPAFTDNPAPTFSGTAGTLIASAATSADLSTVTIDIYSGISAIGTPVQILTTNVDPSGNYSLTAATGLAEGTYTAEASQSDALGNIGYSTATTFTVDLTAPIVSLNAVPLYTPNTTPTFSGTAGTVASTVASSPDAGTVTINIYSGTSTTGELVQTLTANVGTNGIYSATSPGLAQGTYTVQTTQPLSRRRATSGYSNTNTNTTLTVDNTARLVNLSVQPLVYDGSSKTFSVSFSVTGSDNITPTSALRFQVSLDGSPATSPLTGLACRIAHHSGRGHRSGRQRQRRGHRTVSTHHSEPDRERDG